MAKRIQGEAKPNRKMQGFAVPHGPSILEQIEAQLVKAIATHHRALKDDPYNEVKINQSRGVVRGLALAVMYMRGPHPDNKKATIKIEKARGL